MNFDEFLRMLNFVKIHEFLRNLKPTVTNSRTAIWTTRHNRNIIASAVRRLILAEALKLTRQTKNKLMSTKCCFLRNLN